MTLISQLSYQEPVFAEDAGRPLETYTSHPGPPDALKNDFQNARKRNLHSWTQWRTGINHHLADIVLRRPQSRGTRHAALTSLQVVMDSNTCYRDDPTNNPKTLLTYSASQDSVTELPKDNFINYGIPRVKLNPADIVRKSKKSQLRRCQSMWDLGAAVDLANCEEDSDSEGGNKASRRRERITSLPDRPQSTHLPQQQPRPRAEQGALRPRSDVRHDRLVALRPLQPPGLRRGPSLPRIAFTEVF